MSGTRTERVVALSWNIRCGTPKQEDLTAVDNQINQMEAAGTPLDILMWQEPMALSLSADRPSLRPFDNFSPIDAAAEVAVLWRRDKYRLSGYTTAFGNRLCLVVLSALTADASSGEAEKLAVLSYHAPHLDNKREQSIQDLTDVFTTVNGYCNGPLAGMDVYFGGDFNCHVKELWDEVPVALEHFQLVPTRPKAPEQVRTTGPLAHIEISYVLFKNGGKKPAPTFEAHYARDPNPPRPTKHFPLVCVATRTLPE